MKLAITALIAFVLLARIAHAETINVADHGIVPAKDMSQQVNQLLETLKGKKDVTLFFPKGRYEFLPEKAVEKYRAVTNHDNSLKRIAFSLYGFEDFTIDGGGSTFLFHGRICPFILEGSKNVTLKNFSIDWDTPFHHELKVVESLTKAYNQWWDSVVPLMINETREWECGDDDQPQAARYYKQKPERGIPDWIPPEL